MSKKLDHAAEHAGGSGNGNGYRQSDSPASRQFHQVEEIFHEARIIPPAERAALLDRRCENDRQLRAEVESLLAHSDDSTSEIRLDAHRAAADESESGGAAAFAEDATLLNASGSIAEGPGTRIGPYKILQSIGEGGFGVVYMAEQEQPVQRKVALKIIKLGMDTKQVIARFEAERQALAMMDHPNIARVLDAGATETGRPYFVMELVKGIPIVEYCDKNNLTTTERLHLFIDVCHAVQHAHQKGIIHRDLKPSNVLVTLHDSKPVPKVIDFGIAKATSRRLTEKTLFTEYRSFLGTPEYMSPDQAEISGLDVDTRTDIYSLGVLLYELLTGTTPFDAKTLRSLGYAEVQRVIREEEPPKPSTRMNTLMQQGSGKDIARHRKADPDSLDRNLRGDLDWIVMKAMEKDRTRRYDTANDFANDILRYLNDEPVLAGPPSVTYKMRKFIRRHQVSVGAAALIAVVLIIATPVSTIGFIQKGREASRSQKIADYLQDMLASTSPEGAVTANLDIEEVVDAAREVFGQDHATVAAALSSRALQLQSSGDLEGAEKLYKESIRIWREKFGESHINVGTTLNRLGTLYVTLGDNVSAENALRESMEIMESQPDPDSITLCDAYSHLALALTSQGRSDEAIHYQRKSLELRRRVAPHQRFQIAVTTNSLANMMVLTGQEQEVAEIIPQVVADWRAALPNDNPFYARVLTECSVWYIRNDQPDVAEPWLREALEIFENHPDSMNSYHLIALKLMHEIHTDREDYLAAIPIGQKAVMVVKSSPDTSKVDEVVKAVGNLAWAVARDPDLTVNEYQAALQAINDVLGERPDNENYINTFGVLQYRLGHYEPAIETLLRARDKYVEARGHDVVADLTFLALAHHELGHSDEAQQYYDELQEVLVANEQYLSSSDVQRHLAEADAVFNPNAIRDNSDRP